MKKTHYVCNHCGASLAKWRGQCPECSAWGSLQEESITSPGETPPMVSEEDFFQSLKSASSTRPKERQVTGLAEFDRVCGGGLVPGSVLLVGGDPGIGKSTLLLQVAGALSKSYRVGYLSGEEGISQIQLRATRLGLGNSSLELAASPRINDLLEVTKKRMEGGKEGFHCLIIDSIQTMVCDGVSGAPGTVGQIKECTHLLTQFAKSTHTVVLLVGHITKDGVIAGPKLLEHMVDGVLYFEGERNHIFRILRCVKNRFGSTQEIGIFEMKESGLQEVPNPSALFLSPNHGKISGSSVFSGIEGARPILMEIHGLTTSSFLPSPRRSVVGWDPHRLSMILAVLESRCGLHFSSKDVFLSVVGGMKITEPAGDLPTALALLSCFRKKIVPNRWISFGEIGLTGEIRPVSHPDVRLKEAEKLGFKVAVLPPAYQEDSLPPTIAPNLERKIVKSVQDLLSLVNDLESAPGESRRPPRDLKK